MNNKKNYTFSDFLIANTTKPFIIFNNNIDDLKDNIDETDDNNLDLQSDYDFIDFKIEKIENIFDELIIPNLDDKSKLELNKYNSFDKIDFLKNKLLADTTFEKNVLKKINGDKLHYLFSIFNDLTILSSGIEEVSKLAIDYLIDFYKNKFKFPKEKIRFISIKQRVEEMVLETKKAIDDNCWLIINPVFEYEKCISKVMFADLKNNTFGNLIYSNKTKKKNLLKSYFDFKIIANFFKINEIFLLKPKFLKDKNIRKNKLEFYLTKYCSTSKTGVSLSKENKEKYTQEEIENLYVANPNFDYSSKRAKKDNLSIIEHVLSNLVFANYNFNDKKLGVDDNNNKNSLYTCSFEEFLTLIKNKDNIPVDWKITKDDFIDNFNSNKWFNKIFEKQFPDYKFGQKKILKAISGLDENLDVLKQRMIKEFYENNLISINPNIEFINEYKVINDSEAKIAWFDFEGVTIPTPLIDYLPAWNQVISQTSIIKTQNNEIYESIDYVYDPLHFDLGTYKKIIDDLYDEEISYYIIYNISYERSRLNEILDKLYIYYYKNEITKNELEIYKDKILFITSKLVDLCNVFSSHRQNLYVNDRIINLGFINGSYSIKKIEYFVTQNKLGKYLKHNIIPYSELNIKNGSSALITAASRALNVIKDNEWNEIINDLKKYCHNDVMAMLMTADLIKYLMKNKEEYFKNSKKYDL